MYYDEQDQPASEIVFDNTNTGNVQQEIPQDEEENLYFRLELKLPKAEKGVKNHTLPQLHHNAKIELPRFGFVKQLEKIFQKDLISNNPWLNPDSNRKFCSGKVKKKVRFKATEIESELEELPNCWDDTTKIRYGHLHAPSCKNSEQESMEQMNKTQWLCRAHIIKPYIKKALLLRKSRPLCCKQDVITTTSLIDMNTTSQPQKINPELPPKPPCQPIICNDTRRELSELATTLPALKGVQSKEVEWTPTNNNSTNHSAFNFDMFTPPKLVPFSIN